MPTNPNQKNSFKIQPGTFTDYLLSAILFLGSLSALSLWWDGSKANSRIFHLTLYFAFFSGPLYNQVSNRAEQRFGYKIPVLLWSVATVIVIVISFYLLRLCIPDQIILNQTCAVLIYAGALALSILVLYWLSTYKKQ
jgi:predicted neutral ceramidase superfamily lipid hydrolase